MAGILLHQIGEIGGCDVEPLRQQLRDQQRHRRRIAQERRRGVAEFVDHGIGSGTRGRAVRLVEQDRHLAEHRAGLGNDRKTTLSPLMTSTRPSIRTNKWPVLLPSWRTNVPAGTFARPAGAIVQNRAHLHCLRLSETRYEGCQRRTDNDRDLLKLSASTPRPRPQMITSQ